MKPVSAGWRKQNFKKRDNMDVLKQELKEALIEALHLEDITPEEIADSDPLFGDEGLGLDSIDALEIILIDPIYPRCVVRVYVLTFF